MLNARDLAAEIPGAGLRPMHAAGPDAKRPALCAPSPSQPQRLGLGIAPARKPASHGQRGAKSGSAADSIRRLFARSGRPTFAALGIVWPLASVGLNWRPNGN